jgi:hypothetical protein
MNPSTAPLTSNYEQDTVHFFGTKRRIAACRCPPTCSTISSMRCGNPWSSERRDYVLRDCEYSFFQRRNDS